MSEFPPSITDELLLEQAGFVRALARSLVGEESLAEDLGQEAYVAALTRPPREQAALRPWLARVLVNRARKEHRSRSRRESREREIAHIADVHSSEVPRPEEILAQRELLTQVLEAVRALPEPIAGTIHRRYYLDLPPSSIAAQEGVPIDTVKHRLRRGRQLLRRALDREYGGDRSSWSRALLPLAGVSPSALHVSTAGSLIGGILSMSVPFKMTLVAALILISSLAVLDPFSGQSGTEIDAPAVLELQANQPGPILAAAPPADQGRRVPVKVQHYARGIVRDEKGNPLQGLKISVMHGSNKKSWATHIVTTDAEGRFGIDFTGPGRIIVNLWTALYREKTKPQPELPSPQANLDFVLERHPTGILEIRVRNLATGGLADSFSAKAFALVRYADLAKDHPVFKRRLELWKKLGLKAWDSETSNSVSPMGTVRGDTTKGILILEVPLPDESSSWPVLVKTNGAKKWVQLKAGEKLRVLVEVRTLRIEGRVLDLLGKPVEGAIVYPGNQVLVRGDEPFKPFDERRIRKGVRTDKKGRFVIEGTDRVRQVTAWHAKYTPLTVARGESREIRLQARGKIEGVLVDEMGQPRASTELCMDRIHFTTTDALGRFLFEDVESGLRGIWVTKAGSWKSQRGKIKWTQGPWIVEAQAGLPSRVRLDPKRLTFVDSWTSKPIV